MQLILLKSLKNLGKAGDVVNVKDGYARNYLVPLKMAIIASKENLEIVNSKKSEILKKDAEQKERAEALASYLKDQSVVFIRQAGDDGKLFGSVSAKDIAAKLSNEISTVDSTQVILDKAIKTIGLYTINVSLHPEVQVSIPVSIARSEGEAMSALSS